MSTQTIQISLSASPADMAAPIWWLGLDVSKDTFDVALHPPLRPGQAPALDKLRTEKFPRTRQGIQQLLVWADSLIPLPDQPEQPAPTLRAVMEATGSYSHQLAIWMIAERACTAPAIINPHVTAAHAQSLGTRNKTDKADARVIARFGAERCPSAWEEPTPEHRALRELSRERSHVLTQLCAQREHGREANSVKLVAKIQSRLLKQLEKALKELDKAIDGLIKKTPQFAKDFEIVSSVEGIGRVVFTTVTAECGDVRRFKTSRQLSAFAGLAPCQRLSGSSVHGKSHISKRGNPELRRVLYMAAMVAIRNPESSMGSFYQRLIKAGKPKMAALMAVARKLLVLMRALLITGKKYDPEFMKGCEQNSKACEQFPQRAA